SFCAPPTVWRMLVQADLSLMNKPPQKIVGVGELLIPVLFNAINRGWGVEIRDGFGQTETSVQIANSGGEQVKPGSMGKPLPGFNIALIDPASGEIGDTGEICIKLDPRPVGLFSGYVASPEKTDEVFRDGYDHTAGTAARDEAGLPYHIGRSAE